MNIVGLAECEIEGRDQRSRTQDRHLRDEGHQSKWSTGHGENSGHAYITIEDV